MTPPSSATNRLTILHLMFLTGGIGIALFIARAIEQIRFTADAHYYNLEAVSEFDLLGLLIAAVYGLSVTLFALAIRSGNFWASPGKTIALLFATMCILNWGLELVAATVTHFRLQSGATERSGYVLGIWYRSFAVEVGYVACLPILVWAIYKTRRQEPLWRLTWIAFLGFALFLVGAIHFDLAKRLPLAVAAWYFEAAIGIPICLMVVAALSSWRRSTLDWWTAISVIVIAGVWCVGITLRALA